MALNKIISEGIKDSEVKLADMADDSVGINELSATGTASSSTFLRGDNAWASAADTTKMPLAGGTFTGDVTFDSATNSGMDMVWDESESDLTFNDEAYIKMGDSDDLSIGHNGTNSFIQNTNSKIIIGSSGNNSVELLYANAKKAETVTGGFTVTGVCTATSFAGDGSSLTGLAAGATGGNSGANAIFWENEQTVTHDYTISNNKNAGTWGPVTINSGVTVTVGDGEYWTIM